MSKKSEGGNETVARKNSSVIPSTNNTSNPSSLADESYVSTIDM